MRYKNVLQMIGNTPIVEIQNLNLNKSNRILAKLEGYNPGGSIKDRVALKMIEEAEKSGLITKDKIIIEATSGNTGIGIAMIGAIKGYEVLIVMSESASIERRKMIASFGAKILLTNGKEGTDGAIRRVWQILKEYPEKYYWTNQFSNLNNPLAHEQTAREIWNQTNGEITHLVASIGTSGTLMGLSHFLKKYNPNIQIISAEPRIGHKIQGLKNMQESIPPRIFSESLIDRRITIHDEDAFQMVRDLAKGEGLFVGMSSGAAMLVAQKLSREVNGANIVVILPDRGEKYLSTSLFS